MSAVTSSCGRACTFSPIVAHVSHMKRAIVVVMWWLSIVSLLLQLFLHYSGRCGSRCRNVFPFLLFLYRPAIAQAIPTGKRKLVKGGGRDSYRVDLGAGAKGVVGLMVLDGVLVLVLVEEHSGLVLHTSHTCTCHCPVSPFMHTAGARGATLTAVARGGTPRTPAQYHHTEQESKQTRLGTTHVARQRGHWLLRQAAHR